MLNKSIYEMQLSMKNGFIIVKKKKKMLDCLSNVNEKLMDVCHVCDLQI